MKRFDAIFALAILALIIVPSSMADSFTAITGTAHADMDNDQHIILSSGFSLPGALWNTGSTPVPTTRDCVIGERCHILQTITAVVNVPRSSSAAYDYDFAFAQFYFDMTTSDPVEALSVPPQADAFATGTFTGLLNFYNCGIGSDCPGYNDLAVNSRCLPGYTDCSPVLLRTYFLSGFAEGYTGTNNPRATVDFSFTGTALQTPEPSSVVLLISGLMGAAGLKRKGRQQ